MTVLEIPEEKYSIDDLVEACNLKLIEYGHEIKKDRYMTT